MAEMLVILCAATAAALLGYSLSRAAMVARVAGEKVRGRLEHGAAAVVPVGPAIDLGELARRAWETCSGPFFPKTRAEQSRVRKMLGQAGVYSPSALRVFVACKVVGLAGGMLLGLIAGALLGSVWMGLPVGGIVGYLAPTVFVRMRVRGNARAIERGMADALDLLVVCMEAGLTIDAAMQRVGQELALAHPALSRELGITHMESRVGLSRAEAMKNLGERTAVPSLVTLGSMLTQAERFGTSIAAALQVHAESIRTARQTAAEELASKASVKLSFPLVMFIFPATFIVLVGPTVIELLNSALFN